MQNVTSAYTSYPAADGLGMFTFDLPAPLLRKIKRFVRKDLVDKLVGLSLCPEFQANLPRIITLVHVALAEARGTKRATRKDLAELLNGFGDHDARSNEDPAEDVFVSSVAATEGQYRIFNGTYPASDYSLQRLLSVVLAQDFAQHERVSQQCQGLLGLSEAVAERCKLAVNAFAESIQWRSDWQFGLPQILQRGRATRFSDHDLRQLGIDIAALEPFCLPTLDGLLDAPFGATTLCRQPLIRQGDGIHMPVPSLVSPALRLHLAHAITERVVPWKATADFHTNQFFRWVGVDLALCKTKPLQMADLDFPEPDLDVPGLTQAVLRFDEDKLVHIFVLECDWRNPPDRAIHQTSRASPKLQKALGDYLSVVQQRLAKDYGVTRGLSLVIQDSPGWNVKVQLPEDFTADWYCVGLNAHSFSFLLADASFSLIELWKMLREHRAVQARGIHLTLWPDMLAYWSVWLAFGSTFWPKGLDLRAFGGIAADTSKIVELMCRIRIATARHAVPLPSGEWLPVERWIEEQAPSQDFTKPIFFDPIGLVLGELRCVVETALGRWWVLVARPPFDPEDRQFLYLLWQGAAEWLLRLAQTAGTRLPASSAAFEIGLLPGHVSMAEAPVVVEIDKVPGEERALISLPPSFLDGLMTADNRGEVVLVAALIDALLAASGTSLSDEEKAAWLAEVTADPHLKMLHLTPGGDAGFAADLVAERMSLRFLQPTDMAAAERFMRDALTAIPESGVGKDTETITDAVAVGRALHVAVDVHWARCKPLLRTLDLEQTLVLVSRLIEAIHRERVTSERGAQARSRHYAGSPEFDLSSRATMGQRDAAFQAYRTLAEMALCECPLTGGRTPSLTDIDSLAAEIATLTRMAHDSDAVKRKLISAGLAFRPDGAIEPDDGGAAAFIRSYTMACLGESIALDVDAYAGLFEVESGDAGSPPDENDPFFQSFEAEFGLPLRHAVATSHALQAVAVQQQCDTLALRQSEIEALLAALSPPIPAADLGRFLNGFGLKSRSGWDSKPAAPYSFSDIWPWIFERRLSLMLKPVLVLSHEPNPKLVYGVRQLDMGVHYAATLLEEGVWPKERLTSDAARTYVDGEANRRGLEFESEIATLVGDAGWQAIEHVTPGRLGAGRQLGDVDVLAISSDGCLWWVIECKWFGAARTPREIASWLQDFRGRPGDKLDKHLRRVAWVREHRASIATRLGLAVVPDRVVGKIVTTSPVPLSLQSGLPTGSDVLPRRELTRALISME